MNSLILKHADIVLPETVLKNGSLLIEEGKISKISEQNIADDSDQTIDLQNSNLYAGFIDIHIHGAVGCDVNDSKPSELQKIAEFLAQDGITAWLPTLVPDSGENYWKTIRAIDELMRIQTDLPIAQALGIHYEGIFANEKMCGALRPEYFKSFENGNEISQLPTLQTGIHLTTLAPEVENGIELIKELKKQNWIVSIGHTKADFETLEDAFESGANHLTHFFNAMTGLHHRDLGVVGWALANDEVTFDIIADGVHVHPKMLKFVVENKTSDKVSLISDSVLPTGLNDGYFEIWGEKVSVVDGKTQNERGSIAGSVITMFDAVKMMLSLGFSDIEVSKMASQNPAKLLGVEQIHGSIEVGKRADLVAIDKNGEIEMTIINGKIQDQHETSN